MDKLFSVPNVTKFHVELHNFLVSATRVCLLGLFSIRLFFLAT